MKLSYAETHSKLGLADLELVLALVRGRTLAGAAERLGVDSSTVFRGIKRVEKDIGELLFERGRHGYLPTELGKELAGFAERIETELEEAREAAHKGDGQPSGVLRITTTDTILHSMLLPVLAGFATAYPQVQLELVATNALANLSQRDADVAIRATRKPPEHLVGVQLGTLKAAVFASDSYLGRIGGPPDLARADWVALDESLPDHPSVRWRKDHFPKLLPRYRCNSVLSVAEAVARGLGVGVVPLFVMRGRDGITDLSGPLAELETDLWMLAHPDVRHLHRVKLLFDYLRQNLEL